MGNSAASPEDNRTKTEVHDDELFVASCRSSFNEYNAATVLVRFSFCKRCPHGSRCSFLSSEEHGARYAHDTPNNSILPKDLKTIVVWVHGFRQTLDKVKSVASHLLARIRQCQTQQGTAVVAFLWPCHERGYTRARTEADTEAAFRLAALLKQLSMADPTRRIVVVGHSLGCRLACRALQDHDCGRCHHLLLLAAALDHEALMPQGEFDRLLFPVGCLLETPTVLFSRHDDVLRKHLIFGEVLSGSRLSTPLGLSGPSPRTSIDRARAIDCSSDVASHHSHAWLLSKAVQSTLAAVLTHAASFSSAPAIHLPRHLKVHDDYFSAAVPSVSPASSSSSSGIRTTRNNSNDEQAEPPVSSRSIARVSPPTFPTTKSLHLQENDHFEKEGEANCSTSPTSSW